MNKRHIVCFGDSNTWGYNAQTGARYDDDVRWTRRLAALLGEEYMVLEEGVSGRTTVFEDPLFEGLCGYAALAATLFTHSPLSLLVIMLGTNDCKERFSATPQNIADGLQRLLVKAKGMDVWADKPRILAVAPMAMDPRVYEVERICDEMGARSVEKSLALPRLIQKAAFQSGCHYLDCNSYVTPGTGDYMHFDLDSNRRFAAAMAETIRDIFSE